MEDLGIVTITDSQFNHLRGIVYDESGIKLNDSKKALMQARLMRRMRTIKIPNFDDYISYLDENYENEIVEFINVITTNKTEFFRENFHFDFLKQTVFPAIANENEIRIWSAGCSTGEEPYTIAITAREYFGSSSKPAVKILATDIDTNVLTFAYNGIYKAETVDFIDQSLLMKYFKKGVGENDGSFMVKDEIKQMISFARLNLLDDAYPMKKKFHIIFCRNVIIYFDRETQHSLFRKYTNYLAQSGYLFLGHSETLSGCDVPLVSAGRTIYRKLGE